MPKFLMQAQYSTEGLKRLMQDTAAVRTEELKKAVASVGGRGSNGLSAMTTQSCSWISPIR